MNTPSALQPDQAVSLTKATMRAGSYLGLTGPALAKTIGLNETAVGRLLNGEETLDPDSRVAELSLLVIRMYQSLAAQVGADDKKAQLWMNSFNTALGGVPVQLIERTDGLVSTLNYLEGMNEYSSLEQSFGHKS